LSAARRLVLEALYAADGPVTAEEIAHGLAGRFPSSDLASVYRNLETLEELGLVCHMHLGHSAGLYVISNSRREYVSCEQCGAFDALSPEALEEVHAAVRAALGYEARFSHFPIVGICPTCAEDGDRRAPD
jgi:Fur family ferric uptake transcriptional regulator